MWARLDDGIIDHEKIEDAAERLGGAYAYERVLGAVTWGIVHATRLLTDGFLSDRAVRKRGLSGATIDVLLTERLWHRIDGGYQIHDFLDWNPSGADVKARRSRDLERKRSRAGFRVEHPKERQRDIQSEHPSEFQSEARANSAAGSSRAVPVPSRPVPQDQGGWVVPAVDPGQGPAPPPPEPGNGHDTGPPDRIDLAPGQARAVAGAVIAAWNHQIPDTLRPVAHEPASLPRVVKAVQARGWPIDTWTAIFAAVRASSLLTGQVPGRDGQPPFRADFWWVLEHLDEIAAGRYADRAELRPHERPITVAEARAIFTGRP